MTGRAVLWVGYMFAGFLAVALPAHASNRDATETLLELFGFDAYVESIAEALRETDGVVDQSDTGFAVAWDLAAAQVFPASAMMDEILDALDGSLSASEIDEATMFLTSDLGARVTELEVAAQAPGLSAIVEAEGAEILADLIAEQAPRLDEYTRMIEALGAVDSQVAAAMNLNFAIYSGMSQSGKLPYQLSEAEILGLLAAQQDQMRAQIRDHTYINMAYTYRDLPDQDLSGYIDFLTSDVGRALYGATNLATEQVLGRRARLFGSRLMELQGVQEL